MTTAAALLVRGASEDELRAFLASYGVALSGAEWECVCGVGGPAPSYDDAARVWRVHYVTAHVAPGDLSHSMAVKATNALSERPE